MQILVATLRGAVRQQQRTAAYAALLPPLITTALVVRVPAPAASGYGKIYSYFCWGFRFGLGSFEHNFEGSGLVQVH